METCSGVYLFFCRAGTLVIGRRAENKARQQSAIAYKGRCKGNSADVKDTFKFYKAGIYILRTSGENVYTKESGKAYSSAIQSQASQENSDETGEGFFVDRVNINNERTTPMREPFWS